MKHLKLLLTLSIISLLAICSFADVIVQTTTPKVDPNGASEIVGQLRMIFSSPEFGDPTAGTDYYVLVRIQLSQDVVLDNIGGLMPADVSPTTFVPLALEADAGIPAFSTDPNAVRLVRFGANYLDILFTKNMYTWTMSNAARVRVTIGTPDGVTPTSANNNFGGAAGIGGQADTRLCCNFAVTTRDFQFDDFWRVGMVAFNSDVDAVLGSTYSVNFAPSDPSLAQRGETQDVCVIDGYWPTKGDDCNPYAQDQTPAVGDTCPELIPGQVVTDPCANDGYYPGTITFGAGHRFAISEFCPAGAPTDFLWTQDGTITITLPTPPNDSCLDPTFVGTPLAWLWDGSDTYSVSAVLTNAKTITITLDPEDLTVLATDRTDPVCVIVDLGTIEYDACCMVNELETTAKSVTARLAYEPAGHVCGTVPATKDLVVANVYGCVPVETTTSYMLNLWYPFLPPATADSGWWGGIAITNYADVATDGGTLYLWEEDGEAWVVTVPALGAHELWLRYIGDLEATPVDANNDGVFGNTPMSGILYMQVTDPDYTLNGTNGSLMGIDSFVLMGDGTQAYGYTARHLTQGGFFDPINGSLWVKK